MIATVGERNDQAVVRASSESERQTRARAFAFGASFGWFEIVLAFALALVARSTEVRAQAVVSASPDVTIALGSAALVTEDQAVAVDNQLGIVALQPLGPLPDWFELTGYADGGPAIRLFTLDATVVLTAGLIARPGDVVAWNGTSFSIAFDGEAEGLPIGLAIDAVSFAHGGGLVLSFDQDASLPGPIQVADEDLVRWNGNGFTLLLDGSATGLSRALDIDAVDQSGPSTFLVSFETNGSVGAVTFADEDVLRLEAGVWSLEVDSSSLDADWRSADLDALQVPEPGLGGALAGGLLFLAVVRSSRVRSDERARRVHGAGRSLLAMLALLAIAGSAARVAHADVGVREIDQSCAATTGCFSGDTAGFPVTIPTSGSYRLTSNLVLPNENLDAIVISSSGVRIDLGGFAIVGPVVCTGTLISCTPVGTGNGIEASSTRNDLRVENGSITGMANGISLPGTGIHVARVRVGSNRLSGISLGTVSQVSESIVYRNGGDGISVGRSSSVTRCTLSRNGLTGVSLVPTAATGGLVLSESSLHDNQGSGITAYTGSSVFKRNTVYSNGVHGISANGGAQVSGNVVVSNADRGLDLGTSDSGYSENMMSLNGTDVVGGLSLGGNSCAGAATCP